MPEVMDRLDWKGKPTCAFRVRTRRIRKQRTTTAKMLAAVVTASELIRAAVIVLWVTVGVRGLRAAGCWLGPGYGRSSKGWN
jgi:hypothetical protein